ncbi:unnamed protein product, partial [Dibothriocephalus latus]
MVRTFASDRRDVVHPGDVVSLLLENQTSHHYEYSPSCAAPSTAFGGSQRMHKRVSSDAYGGYFPSPHSAVDLSSLPPSENASGRE